MPYAEQYQYYLSQVEDAFDKYLPSEDTRPAILHQAMNYSMRVGGKRLRPVLVCAARDIFSEGADPLPAAVAVECVHTYSLIHDDLPCMDNSDLRRGKPTCHKRFDESTALLAGDALLTHSFAILSKAYDHKPLLAVQLLKALSLAAGSEQLIGGQVEDTMQSDQTSDQDALRFIHLNKTSAMIRVCFEMGFLLAGQTDLSLAKEIGIDIGMAFQYVDDILDVEQDTATLGKPAGLDIENEKLTAVTLFGVEGAKQRASAFSESAITKLHSLHGNTQFLEDLVKSLLQRVS